MNIDCTMYREVIGNVKAWTRGGGALRMNRNGCAPCEFL